MNYLSPLIVSTQLSPEKLDYLQGKLEQLGNHYQVEPATLHHYQKKIWAQHQEPHRHYHNLSHLYNLLVLLEQQTAQQPSLLELAIWYHDYIYDPNQQDNEAQSAQWAQQEWQAYLSLPQQQQLHCYITATTQHQPLSATADELLFLDLDLSILAAAPSIYKAYSQAIEKEYTTVYPLELYRKGRQKVLQTFLERSQLYYSNFFLEHYEAAARANLQAEIQQLQ